MKDNTSTIQSMIHRVQKRYKHLSQWAKRQSIDYYRLYDRDIPGTPVMIDVLPDHWLVWVCDHSMQDNAHDAFMADLSTALKSIKSVAVIIKNRQKKSGGKPTMGVARGNGHDQKYRRRMDDRVVIQEGGIQFELNLTRYLDTGLFIDHRQTRALVGEMAKGKRLLNLYAYTGSFSCYALKYGANFVTSVDLNPVYGQWQERNYQLNGFSNDRWAVVTSDVIQFLNRHRSSYDIIVCDPPSFSQSKRKRATRFQVQDDASSLILQCWKRLKGGGKLLFSTNYRGFKFDKISLPDHAVCRELTNSMCAKDFDGKWASRCWLIDKKGGGNIQ